MRPNYERDPRVELTLRRARRDQDRFDIELAAEIREEVGAILHPEDDVNAILEDAMYTQCGQAWGWCGETGHHHDCGVSLAFHPDGHVHRCHFCGAEAGQ